MSSRDASHCSMMHKERFSHRSFSAQIKENYNANQEGSYDTHNAPTFLNNRTRKRGNSHDSIWQKLSSANSNSIQKRKTDNHLMIPENHSNLYSRQLSSCRELEVQQPGMHLCVPIGKYLTFASPEVNYVNQQVSPNGYLSDVGCKQNYNNILEATIQKRISKDFLYDMNVALTF